MAAAPSRGGLVLSRGGPICPEASLSVTKRGGLIFKAHKRVYHSTLGLRVIQKKRARAALFRRRAGHFL